MTNKQELIFNVTHNDFQDKVIKASEEVPVVADFWAPWCTPCKVLEPILEKIVLSLDGQTRLARINIEQERILGIDWGIQSVPTVKIFRNGEAVGEFIGVYQELDLRLLLERFIPTEADRLTMEGNRLLEQSLSEAAEATFYQALQLDQHHPVALLHLAELCFQKGERDKARQFAKAIDEGEKEHEAAGNILARIDFLETCEKVGDKKTCQARVGQDPDDLDARYDYALCLAAENDYKGALDELLFILEKDKEFKNRSAHKATLRIFSIIGEESEFIDDYRSRLSMILFS
jgi:putative thioredoxin